MFEDDQVSLVEETLTSLGGKPPPKPSRGSSSSSSTAKKAAAGMGGLAIGLMLVLIHLISIPVTNTSVNPARSTSQAIFAGSDQLQQLWLFWVAPIIGGVIGAVVYRALLGDQEDVEYV